MLCRAFKWLSVLILVALLAMPFAVGQWVKHDAQAVIEDGYQHLVAQLVNQEQPFEMLDDSQVKVGTIHSGWFRSKIDAQLILHDRQYPLKIYLNHGPMWLDGQTPRFGLFSLVVKRWPSALLRSQLAQVHVASTLDVGFHENGRASITFDTVTPGDDDFDLHMTWIGKGRMDKRHHFDVDYVALDLPHFSHDGIVINGLHADANKRYFSSFDKTIYDLNQFHVDVVSHAHDETAIALHNIDFQPTFDDNKDSLSAQWDLSVGQLTYAFDGEEMDLGSHDLSLMLPAVPSDYLKQLMREGSDQFNVFFDAIEDRDLSRMNVLFRDSLQAISGKQVKLRYRNDAPHTQAHLQMAYTVPALHYVFISPDKGTDRWCLLEDPHALDRAGMDVILQQPCVSTMMPALAFQSELAKLLVDTFKQHSSLTLNIAYKNHCQQIDEGKAWSLKTVLCSWFGKTLRLGGITPNMFIEGGNGMQTLDMSWHQGKQFINGEVVNPEPEAYQKLSPVLP